MTSPTVSDYLKYANLQMAAEAFLAGDNGTLHGDVKINIKQALIDGNGHALRFTSGEATKFTDPVDGWTVLDQCTNTPTGFSGTLFKNNKTGELVISFRSTEFIDDAVRDSLATNTQEIKATGFTLGQIADMEKWYGELKSGGKIPTGAQLNVTGYSLGGHLATAFNMLHGNELNGGQVVTFNGAGVGEIKAGNTLQGVLNEFINLRDNPAAIEAALHLAVNFALTDANPNRPLGQAPDLDGDIFDLPWLRGYGDVKSLHIAYQEDPALKQAAADLTAKGGLGVLRHFDTFIAQWSGLAQAHQDHNVSRTSFTTEDKAWMLEKLTSQHEEEWRMVA